MAENVTTTSFPFLLNSFCVFVIFRELVQYVFDIQRQGTQAYGRIIGLVLSKIALRVLRSVREPRIRAGLDTSYSRAGFSLNDPQRSRLMRATFVPRPCDRESAVGGGRRTVSRFPVARVHGRSRVVYPRSFVYLKFQQILANLAQRAKGTQQHIPSITEVRRVASRRIASRRVASRWFAHGQFHYSYWGAVDAGRQRR